MITDVFQARLRKIRRCRRVWRTGTSQERARRREERQTEKPQCPDHHGCRRILPWIVQYKYLTRKIDIEFNMFSFWGVLESSPVMA